MKRKLLAAKARFQNFVAGKMCGAGREDGDHLVEVLGTIIIAVVILLFFRGMITNMFQSMMNSTNTKVESLFSDIAHT